MDKKMLIVCGPTATGKTALAVQLAKRYNGELVSADSRQVYRGMDVGTGKDILKRLTINNLQLTINFKNKNFQLTPYNMDGIGLWLYDVVNPDEEFSVAHYQHLATSVIEDIQKRGKLPIVVGGTGLYIMSILSPLETSHIPQNKELRKCLQALNTGELQERLKKDDTAAWDRMNQSDRQNPRRLMRKIEMTDYIHRHPDPDVSSGEGSRPGQRRQDSCLPRRRAGFRRNDINRDILLIGLTAPYAVLYKRIDERVEKRVKSGIIEEITSLLGKGYSWDLPSMNTFGYKEWKLAFQKMENGKLKKDNDESYKDIIQRWKWDEHGYARRQMAWFRKMKEIHWVDISQDRRQEKVETKVRTWYTKKV